MSLVPAESSAGSGAYVFDMTVDQFLTLDVAAQSVLPGQGRKTSAGKKSPKPFEYVSNCCNLRCFEKVPEECQERLYGEFCEMEKEAQDLHLSGLIDFRPPTRYTVVPKRRRDFVWRYTIVFDGKQLSCCRRFLVRLYQISEKRIRIVQEKTRNGEPFVERRGKHQNRPHAMGQDVWPIALEHLDSVPHTQGLDGTEKKFFKDSTLNVKKVWKMFRSYYKAKTGKPVKQMAYRTYYKRFTATKMYGFLHQLVIPDKVSGKICLDELPTREDHQLVFPDEVSGETCLDELLTIED